MDPDQLRAEIMELVRKLQSGLSFKEAGPVALRLTYKVVDLDQWLASGGRNPRAWHHHDAGCDDPTCPDAQPVPVDGREIRDVWDVRSLLDCGCPRRIVADTGHQEGCEQS